MNNMKSNQQDTKLCSDLENWMSNLPQELKNLPFKYLAIPGSHDSFTSKITIDSDLSPDANPIFQSLAFLGRILKYFMVNWSVTQPFLAEGQLLHGIRYFDLRIATKENEDNFYIVHGLYSCDISTIFQEVVEFLQNHPNEVIILDCQHFYALTLKDHERLMGQFQLIFGQKLVPYMEDMDKLTLDFMNSNGYQVIVVYRSDAARFGYPQLWPSSCFPTPWPDTDNIPNLIDYLDEGIKKRDPTYAMVSQCVLTPSTWFVIFNLFSTLKQKCAVELEKQKLEWISRQRLGKGGVNIIISDFIELSDFQFVKNVIGLNAVLLEKLLKTSPLPPIEYSVI